MLAEHCFSQVAAYQTPGEHYDIWDSRLKKPSQGHRFLMWLKIMNVEEAREIGMRNCLFYFYWDTIG